MSTSSARGHRYFYYRCSGEVKSTGCRQRQIAAGELDRFIVERVLENAIDTTQLRRAAERSLSDTASGLNRLKTQERLAEQELNSASTRVKNLMDLASRGGIMESESGAVEC